MRGERFRNAVVHALSELSKIPAASITDGDRLVDDLGIDSLGSVDLLLLIEDRAGKPLPEGCEGSFVGAKTVGELVSRISEAFVQGDRAREAVLRK